METNHRFAAVEPAAFDSQAGAPSDSLPDPLTDAGDLTARHGVSGTVTLMIAHCAGMVDLVALPVWVGTLISIYRLDPQQAGLLATLYLAGAVVSSLFFSPRLNRVRARVATTAGFGIATLGFVLLAFVSPGSVSTASFSAASVGHYPLMAALHAIAGIASGCGLSFTHGTIGRSRNPHRLFAIAGLALGAFSMAFLGITQGLIAQHGGQTLFWVFACVMSVATLACAVAFPAKHVRAAAYAAGDRSRERGGERALERPFDRAVWFGILGVGCMALTQSMLFSFVQRIGLDRGFGLAAVTTTLIALGAVNLIPAPLAALLERRLPARRVVLAGPVMQAALALIVTRSLAFAPYAAATSVYAAVMIFTHTYAFGMLARMDRTGRAVAATPAMLMTGAAIGPVLGGTLVMQFGYDSLGLAAVLISIVAVICFSRLQHHPASSGVSA